MKRILLTGAEGFIGSNCAHRLANDEDYRVHVMDKRHSDDVFNLADLIGQSQVVYHCNDISDSSAVEDVFRTFSFDYIINFAAETHVDHSIVDSSAFAMSNFVGVQVLLDACLRHGCDRFLQVSTDEVYGDISGFGRPSIEEDNLAPRNPYSATKAGAEHLVMSYHETHGLDVVMTRGANTYGPRQYPEKIIPLFIMRAMRGETLPVYGDGSAVRDYMYVDDHVDGILHALLHGENGMVYNVGTGSQYSGLDIAEAICEGMEKEENIIEFVEDRKGHDYKYCMSIDRIQKIGWNPNWRFNAGLYHTVRWYRDNMVRIRDWKW